MLYNLCSWKTIVIIHWNKSGTSSDLSKSMHTIILSWYSTLHNLCRWPSTVEVPVSTHDLFTLTLKVTNMIHRFLWQLVSLQSNILLRTLFQSAFLTRGSHSGTKTASMPKLHSLQRCCQSSNTMTKKTYLNVLRYSATCSGLVIRDT